MIDPEPTSNESEDPAELEVAADETPAPKLAPELSEETEKLVAWDEPPESAGHRASTTKPEDETSIAADLVEKGIDAADRERRIAAADPDFEP